MEGVKPETVIEILEKHNVHISIDQARLILALMFKFARITLTQNG